MSNLSKSVIKSSNYVNNVNDSLLGSIKSARQSKISAFRLQPAGLPDTDELRGIDQFLEIARSTKTTPVSSAKPSGQRPKSQSQEQLDVVLGKRSDVLPDLDEELESLAGSDFDDLDQMVKYTKKPFIGNWYSNCWTSEMSDFGLTSIQGSDIPPNFFDDSSYASALFEKEMEALKRFSTEGSEVANGNTRGYHIIIGAKAVHDFTCKHYWSDKSIVSGLDFWDRDPRQCDLWKYIKAFPMFLGFLLGTPALAAINSGIDEEMREIQASCADKEEIYRKLPAWTALARSKTKSLPFEDCHYIWSLEGVAKYASTKDIKYLHFHLVVLAKDSRTIRTERVVKVIKSYSDLFNRMIAPGALTINGVRSKNQLFYIGKEKQVVGVSVRVPHSDLIEQGYMKTANAAALSLLFSWGRYHFEELFNTLSNHFAEVSTYTAVSCSTCDKVGVDDKDLYCRSWGWDPNLLRYLRQNSVEPFMSMFKSGKGETKSFEAWLTEQNESPNFCARRVLDMAKFRGVLLARCLSRFGLGPDQIAVAMQVLTNIFYTFSHDPANQGVYDRLRHWIGVNQFYANADWRHLLVIGGPGGVGKSTLSRCLHAGLGLPSYSSRLNIGSEIGRDSFNPLSLLRFYDEVHAGKNSWVRSNKSGSTTQAGANIFFSFADVEKNQSVIFEKNSIRKGREWILAASADIYGFPTHKQYVVYHGEIKADYAFYREWKCQAERRFTVLVLESLETFQLPYLRLFYGQHSYVNPRTKLVQVSGVPLLGKY